MLKFFAKFLVKRLMNIIPTLIKRDQMRFVTGRQASNATRRILKVIHYAERTQIPSLLLPLNTEKAFDRVHWQFMSMVLSKFGFKGDITSAILALYSIPLEQVFTSCPLSKTFSITNGT